VTIEELEKRLERILLFFEEALSTKWSRFVDDLVVPAAEKLLKSRGILVDRIYQRVKARKKGKEMEVDILAVDGEHAVLIEAKSTLGAECSVSPCWGLIKDSLGPLHFFKDFIGFRCP